jgi:hypothetical protein
MKWAKKNTILKSFSYVACLSVSQNLQAEDAALSLTVTGFIESLERVMINFTGVNPNLEMITFESPTIDLQGNSSSQPFRFTLKDGTFSPVALIYVMPSECVSGEKSESVVEPQLDHNSTLQKQTGSLSIATGTSQTLSIRFPSNQNIICQKLGQLRLSY